jgi:hypothetical protein
VAAEVDIAKEVMVVLVVEVQVVSVLLQDCLLLLEQHMQLL